MKTIIMAIAICVAAYWLNHTYNEWVETKTVDHTASGGLIGAGLGLLGWLVLGSVGIATGGTAFGVGAAGMTLVGGGVGALSGSAASETIVIVHRIPMLSDDYARAVYIGATLLVVARFIRAAIKSKSA